mmetsp:Transcript_137525/g.293944  ORF Transcript_137525/g.293944 Transcript_137525/m.293944 type:complete len:200 (-) Transcript_137525:282-881(-)
MRQRRALRRPDGRRRHRQAHRCRSPSRSPPLRCGQRRGRALAPPQSSHWDRPGTPSAEAPRSARASPENLDVRRPPCPRQMRCRRSPHPQLQRPSSGAPRHGSAIRCRRGDGCRPAFRGTYRGAHSVHWLCDSRGPPGARQGRRSAVHPSMRPLHPGHALASVLATHARLVPHVLDVLSPRCRWRRLRRRRTRASPHDQ